MAAVAGFALAAALAVPLVFLTLVAWRPTVPGRAWAARWLAPCWGRAPAGWARCSGARWCRLAGQCINALSERLAENGLLAVIALRLVPVAPFAVVNMVAGASHIRLLHLLLLGTAIGMMPSTLAMMFFVEQITERAAADPLTFALLALTALLPDRRGLALQRWMRRLERRPRPLNQGCLLAAARPQASHRCAMRSLRRRNRPPRCAPAWAGPRCGAAPQPGQFFPS